MRIISARERGELESREFFGDEYYLQCRSHHDELLSNRKKRTGKPDEIDRAMIEIEKAWIAHYENTLFHSSSLAITNSCVCARCERKRKATKKNDSDWKSVVNAFLDSKPEYIADHDKRKIFELCITVIYDACISSNKTNQQILETANKMTMELIQLAINIPITNSIRE